MKSALIYPAFMLSVIFGVMILFAFVLLPRMETLIKDLGGDIPFMTKLLKSMAMGFVYSIPLFIILSIVGSVSIIKLRKTATGRYGTDRLLLKLPMVSSIMVLFTKTGLTNLMSTLLSNGVHMSNALELAEASISNMVLAERFVNAKIDILDGKNVCEAFEKYGVFDGEACDILEIGEKTGDLASAFRDVYKMYDDSLKIALKKMVVIISGAAMGFAFAMAGMLVFGMLQTVMSATTAVS
jgi:type II secretory pathway component PulF